mmetsp:Transcript_74918/g.139827  ORF Transcript_74918/g.139827 Transcript_74918/m.139827 type:complete len:531 (-) Transcript_74918:61-1653(-)
MAEPGDNDVCRICFERGPEPLTSPCAGCRGSSAFAHESCITRFYEARGLWWSLSCPSCKFEYAGKVAAKLGEFGLARTREECAHPVALAVMLTNLGNAYGRAGNPVQQRKLLEQALAIEEKEFGPNHAEVSITLTNLGSAYSRLGQPEKQRELLEQAIKMKEAAFGPDHPEVAVTLTNLGNAYGDLGNAERQREMLERALRIKEKAFGPRHRAVAVTLANLGNAYGRLGDPFQQRAYLLRALEINQREYGPNHPEVALTLTNLSNAYGRLGQPSKQLELLERALCINKREYGSDHREVAVTLANMSCACKSLRDYRTQHDYLEQVLRIREKLYGCNHPALATTLSQLSGACGRLGNYARQCEVLEQYLMIIEEHEGCSSTERVSVLTSLCRAYTGKGDAEGQQRCKDRLTQLGCSLQPQDVVPDTNKPFSPPPSQSPHLSPQFSDKVDVAAVPSDLDATSMVPVIVPSRKDTQFTRVRSPASAYTCGAQRGSPMAKLMSFFAFCRSATGVEVSQSMETSPDLSEWHHRVL